jgi:hypothetical protein
MTYRLLSILAAICIYSSAGHCAAPGETGGQALKLATDARPIAQGEAFCAVADDVSAIYWNPAGLTQLTRSETFLTHMNRLMSIRYVNLAYAQPLNKDNAIGLGFFGLYTSDTRRDEITGNPLGDFMNYNTYLTLAYGRRISYRLSVGLAAKVIYNRLDTYQSGNIAFDVSGFYAFPGYVALGVNLQNIDAKRNLFDHLESVPFNVKAGIAKTFYERRVTAAMDFNLPSDTKMHVGLGLEYWVSGIMAVRAGYKHKSQSLELGGLNELSVGCGFKYKRYRFDYAFTPYGDLGNITHRVTFGFNTECFLDLGECF